MRLSRTLAAIVVLLLTPSAAFGQQRAVGPTARCRDGSYSYSHHHRGTCSHHGGVAVWLDQKRTPPVSQPHAVLPDSPESLQALPPLGPVACGGRCGVERRAVKTLSDRDRSLVHLTPVRTTIDSLVTLPRPSALPSTRRIRPVETTVFTVEARLLAMFSESDGDYHLVLASPDDPSVTMIAEVPNPDCSGACASGLASTYGKVRRELMDYLDSPKSVAPPLVQVMGVGFFDFLHGQRGVAPNGIELHPVLGIMFQ